jgi:hypothetical protein
MAVQSATSRIQYAGNNSTVTSYAVPFVFLENAHLQAIARTSAGVESTVTLTNHTGAGNVNGGTVRTAVAVPEASTLTIFRKVPITQTTGYAEGGDFPAASHERALDKLTFIAQQNDRAIERSIKMPESDNNSSLTIPVSNVRANRVLGFENDGDARVTNSTVAQIDAAVATVETLASAASGGSAAIAHIASGSGAVATTVQAKLREAVSVKDFGAAGNGSTDDTNAINNAIASLTNGGTIYFPRGRYRITSTVTITGKPIWFIGEGADTEYTKGSGIIVDTVNLTGLRFENADNSGIARMVLQGPSGTSRLTGGSLVETGAGTWGFTIEDSVLNRGYNGLTCYGSSAGTFANNEAYACKLRGVRIRLMSGDYCVGAVTLSGQKKSFQQITMETCDTSAGDHVQFVRYIDDPLKTATENRTFLWSAFTSDLTNIQVSLVDATTFAKTILVKDVGYTIALNTQSVTIVIDAGVSLTSGQYLIFRKLGGVRGVGTTLVYFNGRTGSHKFVNCTGGFGGDGYYITNTTGEGRPNFYYIANGGFENIQGTAIRIDTGNDIKVANCYFAAEEHGLDMRFDAGSAQNISNVFEVAGRIQLTVNSHGFDGAQDLIVRGVKGTDIGQANGRFPAADLDEGTIAGYRVVNANTIELLEKVTGTAGLFRSPVFWKESPADNPSWTSATGNARTRVVGTTGVTISNTWFRAARQSGIRIDSNACQISNCRVTESGAGDKTLFGVDVDSVANNSGAIRVVTKYAHNFTTGDLFRFENLKKSGVEQLSYVYGSVAVVNATTLDVSATGMNPSRDMVSMAWDGAYDTINSANPVFLIPSGANVELAENADDVTINNCLLGDVDNKTDRTPYGIWNKSAKNLQIIGNNATGVRRLGLRNDVAAPDSGFRQVWSGNIQDLPTADSINVFTAGAGSVITGSTSTPALRVTQTGSGNAIEVEDSTNPDSTPFIVNTGGVVVVGHTASMSTRLGVSSVTPVLQNVGNTGASSAKISGRFSNDANSPFSYYAKSRNVTVGGHTIVQNNDQIGGISFAGSDGSKFEEGARIRVDVDGSPISGANVSVSAITTSGITATATATAHGFTTGNPVMISGATGADAALYNGPFEVTVVDADTFTYTMAGTPTASASGTLLANRYGMPSRFGFFTTPDQSTGVSERMRIDNAGRVAIGATPNVSAQLTVTSTTRGFLPPRMTGTQRDAIATPPAGLMVYNAVTNKLNFYNGATWEVVTSA